MVLTQQLASYQQQLASCPWSLSQDTGEDHAADGRGLPVYHHQGLVDLPWLQSPKREERGSSEKGQAVWRNHSTSWSERTHSGGRLWNSWCNSSCFWPLTWTIPIQPTPQMRQHLFSCIQNQAIAMKKYRRAPRLLYLYQLTYPVYCICRILEMSTSENWVECSTCKEWYHYRPELWYRCHNYYDTCIKVPACMLLLLANQLLAGTAYSA